MGLRKEMSAHVCEVGSQELKCGPQRVAKWISRSRS